MKTEESKAIRRFCGAVLEYRDMFPYKTHIKKAGEEIRNDTLSEKINQDILEAIILNTTNERSNSFEKLQRKMALPLSHVEFGILKNRFCRALAKECGFPGNQSAFTKKGVIDMLFAIADEANECITKDGSFNHQVAGVALKAIDQAVRLSGMCTDPIPEGGNEITMDEPSRRLGA